jgi:hypothetical protein
MAEPPPHSSHAKPPAIPGWVKIFAVVAALVVLVFVVLLVTGGHRPRRHGASPPSPASIAWAAAYASSEGHHQ